MSNTNKPGPTNNNGPQNKGTEGSSPVKATFALSGLEFSFLTNQHKAFTPSDVIVDPNVVFDPNLEEAPGAGSPKIEEPNEREPIIPPEKLERAHPEGELPLTLEDIEKMKATAAGSAGAEGEGFSIPDLIGFGLIGHVDSVPRDLTITAPLGGVQPIIFPVIQIQEPSIEPPIDHLPEAVDDSNGALNEPLTFFEKSLQDGTDPNSSPLEVCGNILNNDTLGDEPVTILDLTIPGFQTDKSDPTTWIINTQYGVLTVYVEDVGVHKKGDFCYELLDNTAHPLGQDINNIIDKFQYTFVDIDGDQASAFIIVTVVDDVPVVTLSLNGEFGASIVVDETDLNTNASASFAGAFTALFNFGADNPGSYTTTYSLSITAEGTNSGLIDIATGESILLFMNNGVVEGRISGDIVVFTVAVDDAGVVTLDQIRALTHPDSSNPDDPVSVSASEMIQLTRSDSIVDSDGDTATSNATLNIGEALIFKDDGPSIDVEIVAAADLLSVDESDLLMNASANFADNFSMTSSFGADDAGSVTGAYALSISAEGADSGLIDVATGQPILLYMNSDVVEGRINGGVVVFTVTVDGAGTVTLDQLRALQHPNPNNPNDAVTLDAANLIQLTFTGTVTDKDGDTLTEQATLDIAQALSFHDDGPSIDIIIVGDADILQVDESNLLINATANFADNFNVTSNFGVDDAGSVSSAFALGISSEAANSGLIDVATGQSILLFMNGEVVEGRIGGGIVAFTVSVDNAGTVTLDQLRALQHPNPANPDDAVTLSAANLITLTDTVTIIDKDGDMVSDDATINIGQSLFFDDDGPSIDVNVVADADMLMVDETDLAINAQASFADNFETISNFGIDDAGSIAGDYTLSISSSGANSGLKDVATGQDILLFMNGGVVEGRTQVSNAIVFTVAVSNAGLLTLDQIRAIVHPNINDANEAVTLGAASLIELTFTQTITDKDGDTASSSASINIGESIVFKDDGPAFVDPQDTDQDGTIEICAANPDSDSTESVPMVDWLFGADGGTLPELVTSVGDVTLEAISSDQVELKFYEQATLVAVLTLNADGTDSLQLIHRDPTIVFDELLTGEAKAGGPGVYFVDSSIDPDLTVRVTGNDGDALSEPNSDDQANPSAQGWAVDNNIIEINETIKFESINKNTLDYMPINNLTFETTGFTGGQSAYDIQVKVYYHDGSSEVFGLSSTEGQVTSVKDLAGFNVGSLIDAVDVTNVDTTPGGNVGFRLNGVTIYAQSSEPPPDLNYDFTLKIADKDGDSQLQAFSLHIDGNNDGIPEADCDLNLFAEFDASALFSTLALSLGDVGLVSDNVCAEQGEGTASPSQPDSSTCSPPCNTFEEPVQPCPEAQP